MPILPLQFLHSYFFFVVDRILSTRTVNGIKITLKNKNILKLAFVHNIVTEEKVYCKQVIFAVCFYLSSCLRQDNTLQFFKQTNTVLVLCFKASLLTKIWFSSTLLNSPSYVLMICVRLVGTSEMT